MKAFIVPAAALLALAACEATPPQANITEDIGDNVAEPDITEVPDESADANIVEDAEGEGEGDADDTASNAS